MSNDITVFGKAAVPAFITKSTVSNLGDVQASSVLFPYISLKGKVFTKREGDEKTLITKPDSDEPASSLEVVILGIGPSANHKINSKVWYANGYEEGSTDKPDCYSNDGEAPAADAKSPQAKKCAVCPKNVWGTGHNGQGTECASSKRLAIAPPDDLDNPMLLRVPAGSLTPLNDYLRWLQNNNIQHTAHVVTRIGFDYTVAHQKLTFKGIGYAQIDPTEAIKSDTVAYITGTKAMPKADDDGEAFEQARPDFAKAADKPAKGAKAVKEADDDLPTTPKASVKVDKPAKETKAAPVVEDADAIGSLDDLDFDA